MTLGSLSAAILSTIAMALPGAALAQADTPPAHAPPSPEARAAYAQMRKACEPDAQRLCSDAGEDRRARRQCMMNHLADLSPDCRQAMDQVRAMRHGAAQGGEAPPAGPPPGAQP